MIKNNQARTEDGEVPEITFCSISLGRCRKTTVGEESFREREERLTKASGDDGTTKHGFKMMKALRKEENRPKSKVKKL